MPDASSAAPTTLRVWPRGGDQGSNRSISRLIERINAQEGSFRNTTEDSLREVIRQAGSDGQPQETTEAGALQEDKPHAEKIAEAKKEIVELATQAWTESSHTLDLISLVVSQFNPKAAEFTMTPYIKQLLPAGCLGTEVLEVPSEKESAQLANDLTSFGWKLESLTASADALLSSATRLEKEMDKEAKYWDDVLSVKSKGWSICTMPRERHSLGVRYGFLESSPDFRDRGLAALRRTEDGSVDLDLGATHVAPRRLQVHVKKAGQIIASSSKPESSSEPLEASILQARNNLFDEELFHEISREARALANRGVKCVGDVVVVPLEDDVSIEVGRCEVEEANGVDAGPAASTADLAKYADIPDLAATAFRLLLSHSHRQYYIQRTQLQPPLKKRKQQRPIVPLIQPLLSHIEHRTCLAGLESYISSLNAALHKASIAIQTEPVKSNLHLDRLLHSRSLNLLKFGFANALVEQLCSTLHSTIPIFFGDNGPRLDVTVRTHASGTEFLAKKTNSATASTASTGGSTSKTALTQTPDEMHFSYLAMLQSYLSHLVVLYLVDLAAAQNARWQPTDPDEGELTTQPTMRGEVETLRITFETGELAVTWTSSHRTDAAQARVVWKISDDDGQLGTFAQAIDRLSLVGETMTMTTAASSQMDSEGWR